MDGTGVSFRPDRRNWNIVGGFLQNTIELLARRVYLMVGSKLTQHDFVGTGAQPGARIGWTLSPKMALRAAFSRPVRVPSRLEEVGFITLAFAADTGLIDGGVPNGAIVSIGPGGNPDLKNGRPTAYELGPRARLGDRMSVDLSLFCNDHSRCIGVPISAVGNITDVGEAQTCGAEIAASLLPTADLNVEAAYSHLHIDNLGPVLDSGENKVHRHLAQAHGLGPVLPIGVARVAVLRPAGGWAGGRRLCARGSGAEP